MTSSDKIGKVIAALEQRNYHPAWQACPWLAGELVIDVDKQGRAQVAGFDLRYDKDDGLTVSEL
jgi:hypothetical protein